VKVSLTTRGSALPRPKSALCSMFEFTSCRLHFRAQRAASPNLAASSSRLQSPQLFRPSEDLTVTLKIHKPVKLFLVTAGNACSATAEPAAGHIGRDLLSQPHSYNNICRLTGWCAPASLEHSEFICCQTQCPAACTLLKATWTLAFCKAPHGFLLRKNCLASKLVTSNHLHAGAKRPTAAQCSRVAGIRDGR